MLQRSVTVDRFREDWGGSSCWGKGIMIAVMGFGGFLVLSAVQGLCLNEGNLIHEMRAVVAVRKNLREARCHHVGWETPPAGMVHLHGCKVNLPDDAPSYSVPGLSEVLPAGGVHSAWFRVRLQHNSRRRDGGWKNVNSVGTMSSLNTSLFVTRGVKVGTFILSKAVAKRIPGGKVQLRTYNASQLAKDSRVERWSADSTTSTLYNGDDRVWFEHADANNVSILAGARQRTPGARRLELYPWMADSEWEKAMVRVERGDVDASTMLQHHEGEVIGWADYFRGFYFCVMLVGVWMLLWPLDWFLCCCMFLGNKNDHALSFLPERAAPRNFAITRCCSAWLRAMLMAALVTVVSAFGGWLGFEHGIISAVLVFAPLLALLVALECWSVSGRFSYDTVESHRVHTSEPAASVTTVSVPRPVHPETSVSPYQFHQYIPCILCTMLIITGILLADAAFSAFHPMVVELGQHGKPFWLFRRVKAAGHPVVGE